VPRPYPREFRDDVVRVARNRDEGVTLEQIATDFGVHPMTLSKWMLQADIDGARSLRLQQAIPRDGRQSHLPIEPR
jgi:transposase